jgi:ABC-type glycerol-3-phosphate transport system substrate-binding protein
MWLKKILFLATGWVIVLACIIALIIMRNNIKVNRIPPNLTIWITEWSTEDFKSIIDGFKLYAPEYKNTEIFVEKKTTDPIRYRTLLLNTLTDWTGPDIFMIRSGEDRILEWKRDTFALNPLSIATIESKYEDIFQQLLTWSIDTKEQTTRKLLGVPLWFETLWIFYNKSLLRNIPRTWNEVEKLYSTDYWDKYPTNLWLGPRYTPNASEIISLFSWEAWDSFTTFRENPGILDSYLNFRDIWVKRQLTEDNPYEPETTILWVIDELEREKKTTFDLFMEWDIVMILGYQSTIVELEKSAKRAGNENSIEKIVLTAPIVQESISWVKRNIVRFPYLSIPKNAKHTYDSTKFLEYLTTDDWIKNIQKAYPYLIPPKPSMYASWKWKTLSKVISRAKNDAFIPEFDQELSVFDFWLHPEFNTFISDKLDRDKNIDKNNIWSLLVSTIECSIWLYLNNSISPECEKRN